MIRRRFRVRQRPINRVHLQPRRSILHQETKGKKDMSTYHLISSTRELGSERRDNPTWTSVSVARWFAAPHLSICKAERITSITTHPRHIISYHIPKKAALANKPMRKPHQIVRLEDPPLPMRGGPEIRHLSAAADVPPPNPHLFSLAPRADRALDEHGDSARRPPTPRADQRPPQHVTIHRPERGRWAFAAAAATARAPAYEGGVVARRKRRGFAAAAASTRRRELGLVRWASAARAQLTQIRLGPVRNPWGRRVGPAQ